MKITKARGKNFFSYGNSFVEFQIDKHKRTLLRGVNGSGKCLHPSTEIEVCTNEETFEKFEAFLKTLNKPLREERNGKEI